MMVMELAEMRSSKQRAMDWMVGGGEQKHRHFFPRRSLQDIDFEATHCTNTEDGCTGVNEVRKCTYILGAFRTPLKRQISRRTEET